MATDQIRMLERRYLDTALLEQAGIPRLSLFCIPDDSQAAYGVPMSKAASNDPGTQSDRSSGATAS